jgi:ABC-type glycerol-3-phosphate transport system substrate-binding protein
MNTRRNTHYLMLGILVVASMLLSSCGKATPTTAPVQPASSTQAPAVANAAEPVTINVWVFEGETDAFDPVIASFKVDHPNIDVVVTNFPEGDYTTKIDTALIAGEPPDIGYVYEPKWIKSGSFLALDDALAQYGVNTDNFNKGAWSQNCVWDGKTYCIGTYTGAILLFYNKDIFDQAGVAYPSATDPMTIDDYVAMCAKVTTKSDDINQRIWGCDAGAPYWWEDARDFLSPDGKTVDGYLNDPPTIHFFEDLVQLTTDGSVISNADATSLQGTDLLATGKLATSIIDNVVAIPALETAGFNWGATLIPVEQAGDKAWVSTWTDSYGVFSASKHPQEAQLFLAYMADKGQKARLDLGALPLDMTYADQWAGDSTGRQEAVAAIKLSRPNIFVPGYWDVVGPMDDAFTSMVEDKTPVKDALDQVIPDMQKALDDAWDTWNSIK